MHYALCPMRIGLGGFRDQAGSKASGTDLHVNGPSFFEGLNFMEVRVPDFPSLVIGVTYVVSKDWPFPADVTDFCHDETSTLDL